MVPPPALLTPPAPMDSPSASVSINLIVLPEARFDPLKATGVPLPLVSYGGSSLLPLLMSMGMFMVPPVMISLPVKILMFVLIDGWNLVVRSIIGSIH